MPCRCLTLLLLASLGCRKSAFEHQAQRETRTGPGVVMVDHPSERPSIAMAVAGNSAEYAPYLFDQLGRSLDVCAAEDDRIMAGGVDDFVVACADAVHVVQTGELRELWSAPTADVSAAALLPSGGVVSLGRDCEVRWHAPDQTDAAEFISDCVPTSISVDLSGAAYVPSSNGVVRISGSDMPSIINTVALQKLATLQDGTLVGFSEPDSQLLRMHTDGSEIWRVDLPGVPITMDAIGPDHIGVVTTGPDDEGIFVVLELDGTIVWDQALPLSDLTIDASGDGEWILFLLPNEAHVMQFALPD